MARIDHEHDSPFGVREPVPAGAEDVELPGVTCENPGIIQKVKNGLAERQNRKVHRLDDGRYCTHTVFKLIEQGHTFLGKEAWIETLEGNGHLQRWRRWRRGIDRPIGQLVEGQFRIIAREYTRLPAGQGPDPVDYDRIFIIAGSTATCIGKTASEALLERLKRFEPAGDDGDDTGDVNETVDAPVAVSE